MGELTPIDIDRLKPAEQPRALYKAVIQTHACVESHIREQAKFNAQLSLDQIEATSKRQALADDVLDLKGVVLDVKAGLADLTRTLGGQMQAGTVKVKAKMGWLDLLKIAGAVASSLGLVIFLVQLIVHIGPSAIGYIMGLSPT